MAAADEKRDVSTHDSGLVKTSLVMSFGPKIQLQNTLKALLEDYCAHAKRCGSVKRFDLWLLNTY
jgi:hypothetical protein